MSALRRNLGLKGRIIRAVAAVGLGAGAIVLWDYSRVAGIAVAVCAVFVAFEAIRGWCVLRACGLKTKF